MGVNLAGAEVALKLIDRIRELEAQVETLSNELERLRPSTRTGGTRSPRGVRQL
jgi:outer membrane murein-binding lipoprotein Lpp